MSPSINKFTERAISPNTRIAYEKAICRIRKWLHTRKLGLKDATIAKYLVSSYESGLSHSTCSQCVAAVKWLGRETGTSGLVGNTTSLVLKGIARSGKHGFGQVKGLGWKDTDRVIDIQYRKGTPAGFRNAAMIAMGSDALLRVSEIQAVTVGELEINVNSNGASLLTIPRSKTDQEGIGEKKLLGPRTTELIERWLRTSEIRNGKVFRRLSKAGKTIGRDLTATSVRRIIKSSIAEAGLNGRYSGHSLRVGSTRSLAAQGASLIEIMEEGRWKSARMAAHYASDPLSLRSATARLRYGSTGNAGL